MSKKYNISWKRSDYSRLSHAIRKANKHVDFLRLENPDLIGHIPDFMEYQDIKSTIKTRSDLNRFIRKMKRFTSDYDIKLEKSDRGAVASSWEIKEFNLNQRIENTKRTKRKKALGEMEVTQGGKPTGSKRKEMGTIKENAVAPSKKKFKSMSQKEWDIATNNIDKRLHDEQYQEDAKRAMLENYVKGLISQGFDDETIEMMQHIDLDKFQTVIDTDESAKFDFIYDPLELKSKQSEIQNAWREHVDSAVNNNINVENLKEKVSIEQHVNGIKTNKRKG